MVISIISPLLSVAILGGQLASAHRLSSIKKDIKKDTSSNAHGLVPLDPDVESEGVCMCVVMCVCVFVCVCPTIHKFSKVSPLLNLLRRVTIKLVFECFPDPDDGSDSRSGDFFFILKSAH